jgi:hypothetical protein
MKDKSEASNEEEKKEDPDDFIIIPIAKKASLH